MPVPRTIIDQIKHIIPPLNGTLHKGQSGRVGVFGGALDYTGAPYFAAISALRLGADLSHVICAPSAAQAIKSYSPDLIVHPILVSDGPQNKVKSELDALLSRLHVLIIGPGLGREPYMQHYARTALLSARSLGLFLVLDADALWMIGQENDGDHMGLIKGYARAVLTPNVVEFGRLCKWVGVGEDVPGGERAGEVSKRLGGVVVLEKGKKDIIAVDTNAKDDQGNDVSREVIEVDVEGGPRRCGGQGDVLSGCVGAMLAWGKCFEDGAFGNGAIPSARLPILAAVGGSMVTRTSSKRAFRVEGRGLVTEDMIPHLAKAFSEVFGEEFQGGDKGKL